MGYQEEGSINFSAANSISGASLQRSTTLGDVAEQTNTLMAMSVDLMDRVRNLAERIGASYPPQTPERSTKEAPVSGPIDYAFNQQAMIQRTLGDVSNFVAAISSRI